MLLLLLIPFLIFLYILPIGFIHLFLISLGYKAGGVAPIVTGELTTDFATLAVDPVPQALVLTSIVIDICIIALALSHYLIILY